MPEPFELDESQRRVAEAPTGGRLIVTAGAGQGKTEVVAARLRHLIDQGMDDGDDLLVLSFSRAAVTAVRGRLAGDQTLSPVTVRTFDSLATRLLLEAGAEVTGLRYDQRIRKATDLLRNLDATVPTVELLKHVVVDEVQDLVGDRAEMVLALLGCLGEEAGFTVLGDPLQAIYDFVLDGSTSTMTSHQLLERLRVDLGASNDALDHHYRAQSADARAVVALGERARQAKSGRSQLNKVRNHVDHLPSVGRLDDLVGLLPRWSGRTAVLCDTNGQAMMISRGLAELGVAHRLRRPAEQLSVPAWVAVVLSDFPKQHLDRRQFQDLVAQAALEVPDDAWRLLKATERGRRVHKELDLVALASRIAAGDVPVDLADAGDGAVVVSTVHRAKGLEFDNVVFVEGAGPAEELDARAAGERARVLYVALSRTRFRLALVDSPAMRGLYPDKRPPRRWVHGYKTWQTNAFEFQLSDVERSRPFGRDAETAQKVQSLLRSLTADQGLPVSGRLDTARSSASGLGYELSVDGEPVAVTSETFGAALAQRLNRVWPNNPGPPNGIGLLRLDGVETAAGPPLMGAHVGVGRWGLWLAPRIGGLAQLLYTKGNG